MNLTALRDTYDDFLSMLLGRDGEMDFGREQIPTSPSCCPFILLCCFPICDSLFLLSRTKPLRIAVGDRRVM